MQLNISFVYSFLCNVSKIMEHTLSGKHFVFWNSPGVSDAVFKRLLRETTASSYLPNWKSTPKRFFQCTPFRANRMTVFLITKTVRIVLQTILIYPLGGGGELQPPLDRALQAQLCTEVLYYYGRVGETGKGRLPLQTTKRRTPHLSSGLRHPLRQQQVSSLDRKSVV